MNTLPITNGRVIDPAQVIDLTTILDPAVEWTIDPKQFRSKSRNCPFAGWQVHGWADMVLVGGAIKFQRGAAT